MKKVLLTLAVIFAVCLLLVSCSSEKAEAKKASENYETALSYIESKDYESAYALLKECKGMTEAEALLERFCFVSVSEKGENSSAQTFYNEYNLPLQTITTDESGRKQIANYTYDEELHLTGKTEIGYDGTASGAEFVSDGNGRIIKIIEEGKTVDYTYDINGNLIKSVCTTEDGSYTEDFTYDEKGFLVSSVVTEDDEAKTYTYSYDEDGKLTERDGGTEWEIEKLQYFYDDKGGAVKEVSTVSSIYSRGEFINDENGNVIKDVWTYSFGDTATGDYTYDENGLLIKKVWTYSDGDTETTDYTYDKNGLLIKEVRTYSDGDTYTYDYTYDKNGLLIKGVRTYSDGDTDTCDYTYDENGLLIKEVWIYSDGDTYTYDYTYDENGHKISGVGGEYSTEDTVEISTNLVFLPKSRAESIKNTLDVLGLLK